MRNIIMKKIINWESKTKYAKKLNTAELQYAINDCSICIKNKIDEEYYYDELSIYIKELNKRLK